MWSLPWYDYAIASVIACVVADFLKAERTRLVCGVLLFRLALRVLPTKPRMFIVNAIMKAPTEQTKS